jgi:hypothetical protein
MRASPGRVRSTSDRWKIRVDTARAGDLHATRHLSPRRFPRAWYRDDDRLMIEDQVRSLAPGPEDTIWIAAYARIERVVVG